MDNTSINEKQLALRLVASKYTGMSIWSMSTVATLKPYLHLAARIGKIELALTRKEIAQALSITPATVSRYAKSETIKQLAYCRLTQYAYEQMKQML